MKEHSHSEREEALLELHDRIAEQYTAFLEKYGVDAPPLTSTYNAPCVEAAGKKMFIQTALADSRVRLT